MRITGCAEVKYQIVFARGSADVKVRLIERGEIILILDVKKRSWADVFVVTILVHGRIEIGLMWDHELQLLGISKKDLKKISGFY